MVKPFRLGLLMHPPQWMGGIIYIQNLVKALSFLAPEKRQEIELCLVVASDIDPELYQNLLPLVEKLCVESCLSINFYNSLKRKIGRYFPLIRNAIDRRLVQVAEREKLDFVYPLNVFNHGVSWDFSCDYAAWIPDFQYKYLPYLFKRTANIDRVFASVAETSRKMVLSSKVAENDFKTFFPASQAKTFVLNFRTILEKDWFESEPKQAIEKYGLPDNFFLVSNQFWIHKNHRAVVEALKILSELNIYPTVVCTGSLDDSRSSNYIKELLDYIKESGLEQQLRILGLIPRFDQIQLMRGALAVIQPSLFEGWSTVVEDARSLGKPLILSDIPVHLEQNPPQTHFFDHKSSEDLAEKIKNVLPTLQSGPNAKAEIEARETNSIQCQTYAELFISLAKSN